MNRFLTAFGMTRYILYIGSGIFAFGENPGFSSSSQILSFRMKCNEMRNPEVLNFLVNLSVLRALVVKRFLNSDWIRDCFAEPRNDEKRNTDY